MPTRRERDRLARRGARRSRSPRRRRSTSASPATRRASAASSSSTRRPTRPRSSGSGRRPGLVLVSGSDRRDRRSDRSSTTSGSGRASRGRTARPGARAAARAPRCARARAAAANVGTESKNVSRSIERAATTTSQPGAQAVGDARQRRGRAPVAAAATAVRSRRSRGSRPPSRFGVLEGWRRRVEAPAPDHAGALAEPRALMAFTAPGTRSLFVIRASGGSYPRHRAPEPADSGGIPVLARAPAQREHRAARVADDLLVRARVAQAERASIAHGRSIARARDG